jgi:hypothetical protein
MIGGSCSKRRRTYIVKRSLSISVLADIVNNASLKAFYHKLVSKGKAKMLAIVAVMRKFLIIINNCCKDFYFQCSFSS